MSGIYIGSTTAFAGKNLVAMGLGLHMQQNAQNVGYMKPVGVLPKTVDDVVGDEDALTMMEILGLDNDPSIVTPVIVPRNVRATSLLAETETVTTVRESYEQLAKGKDIMLVGGCGAFRHTGKHKGVDGLSVVRELGLKTILVDRYHDGLNYDAVLSIYEQLGDALIGVMFNDVPEDYLRDAEEIVIPFLREQGVDVLGIIPRDPMLNAIKASELAWRLGGKIISGNSQSQRIIKDFLIGTMQVENFMMYFRRQQDSATIVGGDRADLQLVALEGKCPCLILTGNITPSDIVRSRSEELGVPVIQVPEDTYTVARRMETILDSQKLRELVKIRRGAELVNNAMDYSLLSGKLGLTV